MRWVQGPGGGTSVVSQERKSEENHWKETNQERKKEERQEGDNEMMKLKEKEVLTSKCV